MAFSRSHRQVGAEDGPEERDRHSIVGLSGWLFADLLLAVAVIFLVATEVPKFSDEAEANGPQANDEAPIATLSFSPELPNNEDGIPIWRQIDVDQGSPAGVGVQVVFSEAVRGLGETPQDLREDITLSALIDGERRDGDATGWAITSIESSDPGRAWIVSLVPSAGFKSSTMQVALRRNAVIDEDGNPNISPEPLVFQVQRRPDTVIDTGKASQIVVDVRESSCDATTRPDLIDRLIREIRNVDKFVTNVASDKDRRVQKTESFVSWVRSSDGFGESPRIGFAFIYGSGDNGAGIAESWRECALRAFESFGWLTENSASTVELPVKFFKDDELRSGQLKIELYFFSALGSSE
jgi:hypothetical protein